MKHYDALVYGLYVVRRIVSGDSRRMIIVSVYEARVRPH